MRRASPFRCPPACPKRRLTSATLPEDTRCKSPPSPPELIESHGLKPEEYDRILDIIGREPTFTELGIFSAMWNEHCSYKSSKKSGCAPCRPRARR
ncbi:hypothetical protein ACFOHS_04180 [Jhaorihella thermophila]